MLHHLEHVILILVDERLQEKLLEVLLQRKVDHHLDRVLARGLGDLGDRTIRRRRAIEREEPLEIRVAGFGADRAPFAPFMSRRDQLPLHLGIAQRGFLLGQGPCAQLTPQRQLIEGHVGLEGEQHIQRAAVDLNEHPAAGRRGFVGEAEVVAPVIGRAARAEHRRK